MSYRKELKYRLSYSDLNILKNSLYKDGLIKLYPSRKILSKYFDTDNLKMFNDSEEGLLPRKKIRVRWYENNTDKNLETKISSIEGRFKTSNKLIDYKSSQFNFIDNDYGKIFPSVLISYKREYFSMKGLRITFDSDINYENLRILCSNNYSDPECVMEVKTDVIISEDYITKIIPFPTSRFSKYSRAILHVKGVF